MSSVSRVAGVAGAFDQVALGEGGQHHDGRDALLCDDLGGADAVHLRHVDVHDDQVGLQLAGELDRLFPIPCFADDVVSLLGEEFDEIEADERLIFGYKDSWLLLHIFRHFPHAEGVSTGQPRWILPAVPGAG